MVIVAGHVTVDPDERESYLTGSVSIGIRGRYRSWSRRRVR
jgi:hypothetical protein